MPVIKKMSIRFFKPFQTTMHSGKMYIRHSSFSLWPVMSINAQQAILNASILKQFKFIYRGYYTVGRGYGYVRVARTIFHE